ncbi:hypothetical protein KY290_035933 [Solanum tuberosum]|uniref:Uncharacterized protein n=1 Tax=Solanum tuberosum TaxID=4113 RepID=A0ABQ7TSU2_SOLTU|nr:hypothetical protein KY285_035217 [Solanum tuberosum]KAH0737228.1 hypothetical protein KY290_035933 [Solanum tuberosum]
MVRGEELVQRLRVSGFVEVREGGKKMVRACDEYGGWWGRSYLLSRRQEERQQQRFFPTVGPFHGENGR